MNYFTSCKVLSLIDGGYGGLDEDACYDNPLLEGRLAYRKYRREVRSDIDTYFLLSELEYGDGDRDIPEDLLREIRRFCI